MNDPKPPPPSKTPTAELRAIDAYDLTEIRQRLLDVVERLRRAAHASSADIGQLLGTLSTLGEKLDQLGKNLQPPDLHAIFEEIDAPYSIPNTRFLAERLTEAIIIVTDLMHDAEITGSTEVYEKAKTWLGKMGILAPD